MDVCRRVPRSDTGLTHSSTTSTSTDRAMKARPCRGVGVVGLDSATPTALRCSASPRRRRRKRKKLLLLVVELLGCRDAMRPPPARRLVGVLLGLGLLRSLGGSAGCEAATVKIGERFASGGWGAVLQREELLLFRRSCCTTIRSGISRPVILSCCVVGCCPSATCHDRLMSSLYW